MVVWTAGLSRSGVAEGSRAGACEGLRSRVLSDQIKKQDLIRLHTVQAKTASVSVCENRRTSDIPHPINITA
jgi:hypothetical protein